MRLLVAVNTSRTFIDCHGTNHSADTYTLRRLSAKLNPITANSTLFPPYGLLEGVFDATAGTIDADGHSVVMLDMPPDVSMVYMIVAIDISYGGALLSRATLMAGTSHVVCVDTAECDSLFFWRAATPPPSPPPPAQCSAINTACGALTDHICIDSAVAVSGINLPHMHAAIVTHDVPAIAPLDATRPMGMARVVRLGVCVLKARVHPTI